MDANIPTLITAAEWARRWQVPHVYALQWIRAGLIPAARVGPVWAMRPDVEPPALWTHRAG